MIEPLSEYLQMSSLDILMAYHMVEQATAVLRQRSRQLHYVRTYALNVAKQANESIFLINEDSGSESQMDIEKVPTDGIISCKETKN